MVDWTDWIPTFYQFLKLNLKKGVKNAIVWDVSDSDTCQTQILGARYDCPGTAVLKLHIKIPWALWVSNCFPFPKGWLEFGTRNAHAVETEAHAEPHVPLSRIHLSSRRDVASYYYDVMTYPAPFRVSQIQIFFLCFLLVGGGWKQVFFLWFSISQIFAFYWYINLRMLKPFCCWKRWRMLA